MQFPTGEQFARMGENDSLGYWPWFLLAQPKPFPEELIGSARATFLRFVFDSWTATPGAIGDEAFTGYLAALSDRAIAAMCADYRASFWFDRLADSADRELGRQIGCPVLVII
jgi:haloacetate dehalogenase